MKRRQFLLGAAVLPIGSTRAQNAQVRKLRVTGYPKDGTRRMVIEEVPTFEGPFRDVGTPVDYERRINDRWVSTDAEPEGIDA